VISAGYLIHVRRRTFCDQHHDPGAQASAAQLWQGSVSAKPPASKDLGIDVFDHLHADDSVPPVRDDLLRPLLLLHGREERVAMIPVRPIRRQRLQQVGRHLPAAHEILEPDRMAVAAQGRAVGVTIGSFGIPHSVVVRSWHISSVHHCARDGSSQG
jgi:hypothetical protein